MKMKKIKLETIKFCGFSKEREMQDVIEDNLKEIFGLDFLCSEFQFGPPNNSGQHRIDILAFDSKSKSFVIIECKKKNIHDAIGQGQRYFNLMTECKNDFYTKYQDLRGDAAIRSGEIKWQQAKLILITTGYTDNQKITAKNDRRVDLWEVKKYENNIVSFKRLDKSAPKGDSEYMFTMQEKVSLKGKREKTKEGHEKFTEFLTKGERKHLAKIDKEVKSLYNRFRDGIRPRRNIEIVSQVKTVNYFIANSRIISVAIQKRQLKIWIDMPKGKLNDPRKMMRDTSEIGSWTAADYEKVIAPNISDRDFKYILRLVKQAFRYYRIQRNESSGEEYSPSKIVKNLPKKPAKFRAEEDHLAKASEETKNSFNRFKDDIMALGDVRVEPKVKTVNFVANFRFVVTVIQKSQFKIWIRVPKGKLYDPKKIMRDTSEKKNEAGADYEKIITPNMPDEKLKYILGLVEQSLEYDKKRAKKRR